MGALLIHAFPLFSNSAKAKNIAQVTRNKLNILLKLEFLKFTHFDC